MQMSALVQDLTDHIKVYLVAGTLVAVGVDVATNVTASMTGATSAMADAMVTMRPVVGMMEALAVPLPVAWFLKAVGAAILLIGAALYAANMWCGYTALRNFRFRFEERGLVLKTCGWSAAFLYVLASLAIGLSVNAVYLALVG